MLGYYLEIDHDRFPPYSFQFINHPSIEEYVLTDNIIKSNINKSIFFIIYIYKKSESLFVCLFVCLFVGLFVCLYVLLGSGPTMGWWFLLGPF
jgi:hypothetical protein